MAEGKSKALWSHTSTVVAYLCEINRDHKKRSTPFTPDEFGPYANRTRAAEKPERVMVPFRTMRRSVFAGLPEKRVRASDVRLAPARRSAGP